METSPCTIARVEIVASRAAVLSAARASRRRMRTSRWVQLTTRSRLYPESPRYVLSLELLDASLAELTLRSLRTQPKAPPRPKTTRAQRKANKVKAGKARAALYGNNIKPTPPPVSHKAKGKDKQKDSSSGANANGEDDHDGLKAINTSFPHASTSNLSSSANSPLPSASAQAPRPPFVRPAKTQLPAGPLSTPFESYAPPRGSDSEEDDVAKAWNNRRKGKGRVKVAMNGQEHGEEEEEEDDRLYCICQKLYDPEVSCLAPVLVETYELTPFGSRRG